MKNLKMDLQKDKKTMRLLFVANVDWYVISHRLRILEDAVKRGWDVTVACMDTGHKSEITDTGAKFIDFNFSRSGTNPFKELASIYNFFKLYKSQNADIIHHVSLKPVIYGSVVAKILHKPAVLNAVSGLGYVFTEKHSGSGIVKKAMLFLMRYGFKSKNLALIFQNPDDHNELVDMKVVSKQNLVYFIKGSGVDTERFKSTNNHSKNGKLVVLFPSRMLKDKGIRELREATEILSSKYRNKIGFVLAGRSDSGNKAGVSEKYLNEWQDGEYVKWIGQSKNMVQTFGDADIVVLPSYREGMPKSLIEAASMGKPIVTTDAVGCRECVMDGVNGFLVPIKSASGIADALDRLIVSPELRQTMGKASRELAKKEFDIELVVEKHLNIYQDLLNLSKQ